MKYIGEFKLNQQELYEKAKEVVQYDLNMQYVDKKRFEQDIIAKNEINNINKLYCNIYYKDDKNLYIYKFIYTKADLGTFYEKIDLCSDDLKIINGLNKHTRLNKFTIVK